ncbi:hypothetical protein ACOMHN_017833 [Nucella lapillus]
MRLPPNPSPTRPGAISVTSVRPKLRGGGLKRHDVSPTDDAATQRTLGSVTSELHHADDDSLFEYVANSVVGKDFVFNGPFGQRQVLYLDYIASGKPLTFIEEYISKEVLPTYANTHTTTSTTARQTTAFRNEARAVIHRTTNCTEDDAVIFTGNGVTGTIHKLLHALNFSEPPVVFVGPYEHHSNILPWREMKAEVFRIRQTADGLVDQEHLEEELQKWTGSGRRLVGSFSAASNVTGIVVDTVAISILLHRHGAIALWDYATAAPYLRLDMNPSVPGKDGALAYKDAIFVSPHKFVGGVDTPGVLIAKKNLFLNQIPHNCGGGTVLLVRQTGHRYLQNIEEREEGGTPSIVGAIRAGLIFQLKEAITPERITEREQQLFRAAREFWSRVPNLVILGNLEVDRLPVFSFLIHHPQTGYYLHHNFVACLLNDLFGIQARGGCACAGPYAMDLLGISEEQAMGIEQLLIEEPKQDKTKKRAPPQQFGESQREIFKPGFTRLNLPYFITQDQLNFVLNAVAIVAEHGWKFLPQYKFNPKTGEWKHELSQESKQQKHLSHLSYSQGYMQVQLPKSTAEGDSLPGTLQDCLEEARLIFAKAEKNVITIPDQSHLFEDFARSSRWFLLPSEANEILHVLSQISGLGPAKLFLMPPNKTQGGILPTVSLLGPVSTSPSTVCSSRTTTTSLGSSLAPQTTGTGNGKGRSPVYVRKIKVNGQHADNSPPWKI